MFDSFIHDLTGTLHDDSVSSISDSSGTRELTGKNLLYPTPTSCWQSRALSSQCRHHSVTIEFQCAVQLQSVICQWAGGFVPNPLFVQCRLAQNNTNNQDTMVTTNTFECSNDNSAQTIQIQPNGEPLLVTSFRLLCNKTTDDYGRLCMYYLTLFIIDQDDLLKLK